MGNIPAKGVAEIRLPLKGIRVTLGSAGLIIGLCLAIIAVEAGRPDLPAVAGSLFLLVAGGGAALLEKRVRIEPERRLACVEWLLAGLVINRKNYDTSRIDRVVVPVQQEAFVPEPGTVWVADRSFPVLLCHGSETVFLAFGWDYGTRGGDRRFGISLPSPAFFPTFAKHAAAVLARTIAVPLHYEPEKLIYAPDQIPALWLDPAGVRACMAWRRYVER